MITMSCGEDGDSDISQDAPPNNSQEGYDKANTSFTCNEHVPYSASNPLLIPPADPDKFISDYIYDQTNACQPELDPNCVAGRSITPIPGLHIGSDSYGHIIPTVHAYQAFITDEDIPIRAMADGHIVYVDRTASNEYAVKIVSTCSLMYYFYHASKLKYQPLIDVIAAEIPNWQEDGSAWSIEIGIEGPYYIEAEYATATPVAISQGDVIISKDSRVRPTALDIGVIDASREPQGIINPHINTWGVYADKWIGATGHSQAVHWLSYLSREDRQVMSRFLNIPDDHKPPSVDPDAVNFGQAASDIAGRLTGTWFNPKIYEYSYEDGAIPNGGNEFAALTILADLTTINSLRVAMPRYVGAVRVGDPENFKLLQLDPLNWPTCSCTDATSCVETCAALQQRPSNYTDHFATSSISATTSQTGPNKPAEDVATTSGQVCYDLSSVTFPDVYNQLYLVMIEDNLLHAKYYPRAASSPQCPSAPSVDMSANYAVFRRGPEGS